MRIKRWSEIVSNKMLYAEARGSENKHMQFYPSTSIADFLFTDNTK